MAVTDLPRTGAPCATGWGYRPALDGLRAIAVYLVVVFHADVDWMSNGFIGVDVFFVLSGFLVTSVLLVEHSSNGRIDLVRFYARRVRRLLPAAVLAIVVTAAASILVLSNLSRRSLIGDAQASLLYVANWNFVRDTTDYLADNADQSPFLHFWSLAIEEQFYFLFPALLIVLMRVGRRRRNLLLLSIGGLLLASLVAQFIVASSNPLRAYYGSDTRAYQMLAGALLAVIQQRYPHGRTPLAGRSHAGLILVVLVVIGSSLIDMMTTLRGALAALASVALIVSIESAPRSPVAAWLSSRPMVALGRVSYGTYLWHWPIIVLMKPLIDVGPYRTAAIVAPLSTVLAAVSSAFLETPIRRSRALDRRARHVVAVGLVTSLLTAIVVVPPVLESDRRPVDAALEHRTVELDESVRAAADLAVPSDLGLDETLPLDVDLSRCRSDTPEGCTLIEGSGARVHLIGDSNADMMIHTFLELAADNDWTLSVNTALGCPWQQGLVWVAQDQTLIDNCTTIRSRWYDTYLPALEPDVVIAVNVVRDPEGRDDGSIYVAEASSGDLTADIEAATTTTIDTLTSTIDTNVVVIEPVPYAIDFDPTDCLTTATVVADCAFTVPPEPLRTETIYRKVAATQPRVASIDLDQLACPYLPTCLPYIAGSVVFRNQLHLGDAFLVAQRDQLLTALTGTGLLSI